MSWSNSPNGWLLTQTLNGASTTYEYNARGFLTRLTNRDVGGNVLSDFQNLRYDGVGNRTQMTVSFPAMPSLGGVTNYSYDTKNQLLQEQSTRVGGYTFTFVYDPAQNPTQFKGQSRTYNANNQLIGAGFAYDGNGNPVLYKGVNLSFDPENRMTAYGNILTAGYNGDGLRAWKQTASGRRYFLYDGEELVCELDAAGNAVAGVVFGANGLLVYGTTGYQFDPQGNATHLLNSSGNAVGHLAYDAWGQRMSGNNPTPYGYKGQWGYYTDGETGLLLLTHRYLDPTTGRFLTRDPIGLEGGINLYAYVGNGVVDAYDPTGTVVRFCYRPVIRGIRGKPACHWFLWTSCGAWGYGPGGITKTCLGNLGDFGAGDVTCEVLPATDSQEKCICDNARNAEREWVLCGRVWKRSKKTKHGWSHYDWPGLGCADNPNCQDFVNCLLKKCGLPTQHMTQCEAQGGPRGGNYIIY